MGLIFPHRNYKRIAKTPSGGKSKSLLWTKNNGKILKKYEQMERILMHLQNAPI